MKEWESVGECVIHETSDGPTLHELISLGRSACVPVSPLRQWAMRRRRSREGGKSSGQAKALSLG